MKKTIKIIILILWMILIFILSNQSGGASTNQSNIIVDIIHKIIPLNKDVLVPIVRKTAHITEYFVLFILIYINLKEYKLKSNIYKLSMLFSILYALFDEFHQLFINERSGKITDILVDSIGIILAYILVKYINYKKDKLSKE